MVGVGISVSGDHAPCSDEKVWTISRRLLFDNTSFALSTWKGRPTVVQAGAGTYLAVISVADEQDVLFRIVANIRERLRFRWEGQVVTGGQVAHAREAGAGHAIATGATGDQ
jgi:hypothetical protein